MTYSSGLELDLVLELRRTGWQYGHIDSYLTGYAKGNLVFDNVEYNNRERSFRLWERAPNYHIKQACVTLIPNERAFSLQEFEQLKSQAKGQLAKLNIKDHKSMQKIEEKINQRLGLIDQLI